MLHISGQLMSSDKVVAQIEDGLIVSADETLLPLYLKRTKDVENWLASRAIDTHRVNSRLLKKALRLRVTDDAQTALSMNAATITDQYWFRPAGSPLTYADVRFRENQFDGLALYGDPNEFSRKPSRTPELTNTGSYEKCWRLIDGTWWMYKSGSEAEYFSELFVYQLGKRLGFDMAYYEMDGKYIRTRDFTDGAAVNFEAAEGIVGEDENYSHCFTALYALSPKLAEQYLRLIWMDSLCLNMDRHTQNFGVLRDVDTGEILRLAPNYDNNVALISRGYIQNIDREKDGMLAFLRELIENNETARQMLERMQMPTVTAEMIDECLGSIPIAVDAEYIRTFILNGQKQMAAMLEDFGQNDHPENSLTPVL